MRPPAPPGNARHRPRRRADRAAGPAAPAAAPIIKRYHRTPSK